MTATLRPCRLHPNEPSPCQHCSAASRAKDADPEGHRPAEPGRGPRLLDARYVDLRARAIELGDEDAAMVCQEYMDLVLDQETP